MHNYLDVIYIVSTDQSNTSSNGIGEKSKQDVIVALNAQEILWELRCFHEFF